MPSPHLPLLFLPMLFLSTLFVRTQPYTVSWNISEALKSVNENFVCWLCELWSFSQWQRCWEKSRNRGKWKVQQRKSKLPFLSSILACMFSDSRWYRSLSHHCFLQPIAFFFLPRHGELSKSTPTPRPSSLGLTIILLPLCRLVPHAGIWDGALLAAG